MKKSDLLIASHIKLWRVCDEKTERTNLCNCLCLNPLHDKAFDKGLITLDSKLKMKNVEMDKQTREQFYGYERKQINLPDKFLQGKSFLGYHNDEVFLR